MALQVLASILLLTFSTSQGSLFNPTLEWTCESNTISIAIRTLAPFLGIAHPKDRLSTCSITGNGTSYTKLTIPLWSEGNKCGVRYDQDTNLYSVDVEVHEHRMLILEQDRIFHVTCDKKSVSIKIGDTDGEMLVSNFDDGANSTEQDTSFFGQSPPNREVEFDLELIPVVSDEDPLLLKNISSHDVGYGQSYDMKALLKNEVDKDLYGKRFRVSHCTATADSIVVDLIDQMGCSIDKKIISNFEYGDGFAVARIPSMFKFPKSKTMKLECSLTLCEEFQICKPSCDRKLDDPIPEIKEAKMIAKLLGVEDDSVKSTVTDPMLMVNSSSSNVASTIVHVLERREIPSKVDRIFTTTGSPMTTECSYSNDVIFLYKVIFGLILLLLLGSFLNIICCCFRCKNSKKNSTNRNPGLVKNEFWISDSSLNNRREYQKDDVFVPFNEVGRRDSAASYASIKQRIIPSDQMNNHFQIQENPYRSFRPTQVPSPLIPQNTQNRHNSTFSVENGNFMKGKSKDSMEAMVWQALEIITLQILQFQQHIRTLKRTSKKPINEFCNECRHFVANINKTPGQECQNAYQHLTSKYEILVLGNTFRTQMGEVGNVVEKLKSLMSLEKIYIVREVIAESIAETEMATTKAALMETFNAFVFKIYPIIGSLTTRTEYNYLNFMLRPRIN
ncbi:hypothetical protein FO519_002908 [Halicephalobus sp. NKZ332]|nr:hypothetical protein FO519_002908 [Halicephalobus sp. NKZ332]